MGRGLYQAHISARAPSPPGSHVSRVSLFSCFLLFLINDITAAMSADDPLSELRGACIAPFLDINSFSDEGCKWNPLAPNRH